MRKITVKLSKLTAQNCREILMQPEELLQSQLSNNFENALLYMNYIQFFEDLERAIHKKRTDHRKKVVCKFDANGIMAMHRVNFEGRERLNPFYNVIALDFLQPCASSVIEDVKNLTFSSFTST